jgi:PadR family transcriptional regulator AphA
MSLHKALLGLLHFAPMSGYDLYKLFDQSINNYWSTEHTQIYRALKNLLEKDLIDCQEQVQEGKPDRKIYTLTDLGKKDFTEWLMTPQPLPQIRHTHLLQLSFMGNVPRDLILQFIESYQKMLEVKLDSYKDPAHLQETVVYSRSAQEAAIWELILENGIMYYEAEISWCRLALEKIRSLV